MKVIPIANLFLSLTVIALGFLYSGLHWQVPKLYAMKDLDKDLIFAIVSISRNLFALTTLIAIISVVIGYACLKEKMFKSIFLIIVFGISCFSLVYSVLLMNM